MLRTISALRQFGSFAQDPGAVVERAPVVVARGRRPRERVGEAEGRVLVEVVDQEGTSASGRGLAVVGEQAAKVGGYRQPLKAGFELKLNYV